jgi:hypothetical protein
VIEAEASFEVELSRGWIVVLAAATISCRLGGPGGEGGGWAVSGAEQGVEVGVDDGRGRMEAEEFSVAVLDGVEVAENDAAEEVWEESGKKAPEERRDGEEEDAGPEVEAETDDRAEHVGQGVQKEAKIDRVEQSSID